MATHHHQFSFYNSNEKFLFSEDFMMVKSQKDTGYVQCEMPIKQERINLRIKKFDRKASCIIGIATKCQKRNEYGPEFSD